MQRTKIKVGEVYAYSRGREGEYSRAVPVRVTDLDAVAPVWRYGRKTSETRKVIAGQMLDAKTLEPLDVFTVEAEARNLWRPWSEQLVVDAERAASHRAEEQRRESALAAQASAWAEVRRIVGDEPLRKVVFREHSGNLVEISALTLLAIVEAARDSKADL
jgi:hypothetical protein